MPMLGVFGLGVGELLIILTVLSMVLMIGVVGIIIALAALVALFQVMAWEEWANVVLGVWLVISPWVLGFSGLGAAMWNAVIVGIVVAVLALWTLGTDKDIGGWWSPAT